MGEVSDDKSVKFWSAFALELPPTFAVIVWPGGRIPGILPDQAITSRFFFSKSNTTDADGLLKSLCIVLLGNTRVVE
jgi:hypothetical protein